MLQGGFSLLQVTRIVWCWCVVTSIQNFALSFKTRNVAGKKKKIKEDRKQKKSIVNPPIRSITDSITTTWLQLLRRGNLSTGEAFCFAWNSLFILTLPAKKHSSQHFMHTASARRPSIFLVVAKNVSGYHSLLWTPLFPPLKKKKWLDEDTK